MKNKFLTFLFLFLCVSTVSHASDITHLLGTTGYMIREAMQAGAAKKAPEDYQKALTLQRQAKDALQGTKKSGRDLNKCVELTRKAYLHAKKARDLSAPWRYRNSKDNFYKSIGK